MTFSMVKSSLSIFPTVRGQRGLLVSGKSKIVWEDRAQFGGVGFPFFPSAGEGVADPFFGELYQFFP